MATAMGLFDRLLGSAPAEANTSEELANLAGRVEALEDRMRRHAAMCRYPQMKTAVEKLAEHQAEHLKLLKSILREPNAWPRRPAPVASEGANDWGRLSGDLAEIGTLGDDLHRTAIKFEAFDAATAKLLLKLAEQDSDYEAELRKIALKCDPQAID